MTDKNVDSSRYIVPALKQGLSILQEFGKQSNLGLTAPELTKSLKLPRATIFRMLTTLESLGYLQRSSSESNEYKLGLSVLKLGFDYLNSLDLVELGQPVITELCHKIGFSCNIVIRDEVFIIYVAKVTPLKPFFSSVHVGTRLPAHATAFGRILLADLNLEQLKKLYFEKKLKKFTKETPDNIEDLFNLICKDKKLGFIVSKGFYEKSICTIAAPVFNKFNQTIASLGATIPSSALEEGEIQFLVEEVKKSALKLSTYLNFQPNKKKDKTKELNYA